MLRYSADWRSLAFIAVYWCLVVSMWLWSPLASASTLTAADWTLGLGLLFATCSFAWWAAVITHNTVHSPVFKDARWNRAFQIVLTCSYGFPVSEYVPGHNLSHHRYTQTHKDAMRTTKARSRFNLLNAITFVPSVVFDVQRMNMKYTALMKHRLPAWHRQLMVETVVCWSIKIAALIVDWRKGLLFIFVPHLYAVFCVTFVNYLWHDGCDETSRYNHSRSFTDPLFNWFHFNNGFHAMHHEAPELHWSVLPAAHAQRLHGHVHPALEQSSFFLYFFRTFFWPGVRVRFDGQPLILPPRAADEADWVTDAVRVTDLGAERPLHAAKYLA
jgi:fatty acid desaturase